MRPETLEQLVARVNSNSFIPQETKGANIMAKPVKLAKGKEFTFAKATGGAQASKYPWDEWFAPERHKDGTLVHQDGRSALLMLERSSGTEDEKGTITQVSEKRDYEVATNAMPAKIKTAGRKRYKVVQISRRDADGNKLVDALIIRARDMTPEERQEEDMLRAEEHEATLARRAKDRAESNGTPAANQTTPATA